MRAQADTKMGMYKIEFHDFFTAAFSVDCIIFGYEAGEIKALLIKRAMEPYNNYWAIPGDLVYPDEDLPVAATRARDYHRALCSRAH